jgi:hypothetical protein
MLESVIAVIVGISTVITASALGIKWLTKHYFDEIKHELKPNGGSSLKDQVNRMESDIISLKKQNVDGENFHKRMDSKLDHLTEVFIEYVSKK